MSLSQRLFQLMLLAYPREFRLEYGLEMNQLFRDCYRDIQADGLMSAIAFWRRMIWDVIQTAPLERWETLRKRSETMKNLKRDVMGLVACLIIILVAFTLLGYGRKHEVASILIFGHALDAIITAGVIGNLIIFLLAMTTRLSSFRTALWTLLSVNVALLLISTLIVSRVDPRFNFVTVFVSYVISFAFWLTIHWLRSQIATSSVTSA